MRSYCGTTMATVRDGGGRLEVILMLHTLKPVARIQYAGAIFW